MYIILLVIILVCLLYYLESSPEQFCSGYSGAGGRGSWNLELVKEKFNNNVPEDQRDPQVNYQQVDNLQLENNPNEYNDRKIILDGTLTRDVDTSTLNNNIWVDYSNHLETMNDPGQKEYSIYRVKIFGTFQHTPGGQGFGHDGMYTSRLIADKIIFYEQIGGESFMNIKN